MLLETSSALFVIYIYKDGSSTAIFRGLNSIANTHTASLQISDTRFLSATAFIDIRAVQDTGTQSVLFPTGGEDSFLAVHRIG